MLQEAIPCPKFNNKTPPKGQYFSIKLKLMLASNNVRTCRSRLIYVNFNVKSDTQRKKHKGKASKAWMEPTDQITHWIRGLETLELRNKENS